MKSTPLNPVSKKRRESGDYGYGLKKKPLRRVSEKQAKDLRLRNKIKAELIAKHGSVCMECGKHGPVDLSHTMPLGKGGLTAILNLEILCRPCHNRRHGLKE